jgi:hypothetical protein
MAVLGKCGVMRDFLVETETGEPAPCKMHAQFLTELAFAANPVRITNQQNPQPQLRVNRRTTSFAIAVLQTITREAEVDMLINQPQPMILWYLIIQSEVVEQRFRASVLTHHER